MRYSKCIAKYNIQIKKEQLITIRYDSIGSMLVAAYPQHSWDQDKFVRGGRGLQMPQIFMQRVIQSIFPNTTINSNVRSGHGIIGTSGVPLEIDVYLPDIGLGFEYQVFIITYIIFFL